MRERIEDGERSFSFEFFPPKDAEGEEQLWRAITELEPYDPTFVSVTYGAGGSSRDTTVRITGRIARETSLVPVGHLTCVGHTREELESILDSYAEAGVGNVLALRGDPEDGPRADWVPTPGGLTHASELVELASRRGDFAVAVAAFSLGHPSAESLEHDARVLLAKQRAGAEFAITDMVFSADDYAGLLERSAAVGVDIPLLPGIMPILNLRQVSRMAELSGPPGPRRGARAPRAVRARPGRAARRGDRDGRRAVRGAAGRRRAGAALLHAQPVPGDAGDLLRAPDHRLRLDGVATVHA